MNRIEIAFLLCVIFLVILIGIATRVFFLLVLKNELPAPRKSLRSTSSTIIVLGSGGHTSEMINLVKELDRSRYTKRHYISAASDQLSRERVISFEGGIGASHSDYTFTNIFRSRNVHQSYLSSVFTTLKSFWECVPLVYRLRPDLILCNGPGTCVPVCVAAFLLRLFFVNTHCKIVFVESFCRTQSLSLTGKILLPIANLFIVQWPYLTRYATKIKYLPNLCFEIKE